MCTGLEEVSPLSRSPAVDGLCSSNPQIRVRRWLWSRPVVMLGITSTVKISGVRHDGVVCNLEGLPSHFVLESVLFLSTQLRVGIVTVTVRRDQLHRQRQESNASCVCVCVCMKKGVT